MSDAHCTTRLLALLLAAIAVIVLRVARAATARVRIAGEQAGDGDE